MRQQIYDIQELFLLPQPRRPVVEDTINRELEKAGTGGVGDAAPMPTKIPFWIGIWFQRRWRSLARRTTNN
ncbi:hypothetical protein TIFTF001_043546 [Ficus carica]|uniref:Uncharacterized protein n=1 Tax=Ficus carica TaxID=3494 RepID=A0AA87YSR6_FICCA|nr:hypothetical protein TIFTF001_043546 [Ficus carica]